MSTNVLSKDARLRKTAFCAVAIVCLSSVASFVCIVGAAVTLATQVCDSQVFLDSNRKFDVRDEDLGCSLMILPDEWSDWFQDEPRAREMEQNGETHCVLTRDCFCNTHVEMPDWSGDEGCSPTCWNYGCPQTLLPCDLTSWSSDFHHPCCDHRSMCSPPPSCAHNGTCYRSLTGQEVCEAECRKYCKRFEVCEDLQVEARFEPTLVESIAWTHYFVELSPSKWGRNFGAANLRSPSMSASASVSAGGGADVKAPDGDAGEMKISLPAGSLVFNTTRLERNHLIDQSRALLRFLGAVIPFSMSATTSYTLGVLGYFFLKLLKILGITTKVGIRILNLEVHFVGMYVSQQRIDKCSPKIRKAVSFLSAFMDFILLTWAANLVVMPLSTPVQGIYVNSGSMMGDGRLMVFLASVLLCGVGTALIVMILDRKYVDQHTGEWQKWEEESRFTKIARCIALLARFLMGVVAGCTVLLAGFGLEAKWQLFLGIDWSVVFNFSFSFGLLGWASCLRASLAIQTLVELTVTAFLEYQIRSEKAFAQAKELAEKKIESQTEVTE